jgi:PBP1b-binding outer membrane lipoprotein LpoB
MKKQLALFAIIASAILFVGCGPNAAEQEKLKQETIAIEEATIAVDSTSFEVKKTSEELDAILNQL